MESASALVCGEYSSGEENTEHKGRDNHCDVNYDEVGMDMESSCSSGQEDEGFDNKEENTETSHSVDEGLFSSKEEYEAYQNQFKSGPPEIDNKETEFQEDPNMESEYGRSKNEKMNKNTHSEYGEDNVEKDEYGGWQPSSKNKSKNTRSCETSPSSAREPHRRTNHLKRSDDDENFMSREEIKQKQPQKRPSVSEEKLKDKLLSLSQEEPSSSGSERGGSRTHNTSSKRSRSRSKEKNRSRSPKSTSRRHSSPNSRSRERKREHERHRSSHHRSSKHHHHHRDHRDRDRERERHNDRDRERNYRGNDGRRNRDRISEQQRQELRNKKLVNLGITSNAALAVASQLGNSELGNTDAVAMRAQQMISKQLEAQVAKAKEVTGVELPSYYNPSVINPLKYADQIKKRKLLWGSSGGGTGIRQPVLPSQEDSGNQAGEGNVLQSVKSHEETMQSRRSLFEASTKKPEKKESFNKWETTNFGDDKANDKFRRLMGIKGATSNAQDVNKHPSTVAGPGDKTKFFQEQEAQYERARAITHTQRGLGLGFSGAVQQQPEHSSNVHSSHGSFSDKSPPMELNASNSQRGIGEKLGFIKKSI